MDEARDYELTPEDVQLLRDGGWYDLGFTGLFSMVAMLREPDGWPASEEQLEAFEARLPAMLPLGRNSGWMGLRVVDRMPEPTVLIIRKDENAIVDIAVGRPRG